VPDIHHDATGRFCSSAHLITECVKCYIRQSKQVIKVLSLHGPKLYNMFTNRLFFHIINIHSYLYLKLSKDVQDLINSKSFQDREVFVRSACKRFHPLLEKLDFQCVSVLLYITVEAHPRIPATSTPSVPLTEMDT